MNVTRWNSQFLMLSKFLEALQKDPNLQTKLKAFKELGRLTAHEIKMLKEVVFVLEPFREGTDVLQRDFDTVSWAVPIFLDLMNKCSMDARKNKQAEQIFYCRTFCETLADSLQTRLRWILNDSCYILGNQLILIQYMLFEHANNDRLCRNHAGSSIQTHPQTKCAQLHG